MRSGGKCTSSVRGIVRRARERPVLSFRSQPYIGGDYVIRCVLKFQLKMGLEPFTEFKIHFLPDAEPGRSLIIVLRDAVLGVLVDVVEIDSVLAAKAGLWFAR